MQLNAELFDETTIHNINIWFCKFNLLGQSYGNFTYQEDIKSLLVRKGEMPFCLLTPSCHLSHG